MDGSATRSDRQPFGGPQCPVATGFVALILFCCLSNSTLAATTEADRQFSFAYLLMQNNEGAQAKKAFQQFIKLYKKDQRVGDAHYFLAILDRQSGKLKTADNHLQKITKAKHVSNEALHLLRGQIKLELQYYKTAAATLEKINPAKLTDDAARANWGYLIGVAYRGAANLKGAVKQFTAASKYKSAVRGRILVELGKTQITLKQPVQAVAAFTHAVKGKIEPLLAAEARSLAGEVSYESGQYEQAADFFSQVIENHQSTRYYKPALSGWLRSLYGAGRHADVIKQYPTIKNLLASDAVAEALYLVCASHVKTKAYKKGLETTRQWLAAYLEKKTNLSSEVITLYAECFYHTDAAAFEKWIAGYEKQLPQERYYHRLQFLRANAAIKRNRFDEAIKHLGPLISGKPNPYAQRALILRAELYKKTNDSGKAAADFEKYVKTYGQDPEAVDAGREAINLAFDRGDYAKVVAQATRWLGQKGLDPTVTAPIRLRLGVALIKEKKANQALTTFNALIASKPEDNIATYAHYYRGLILASRAGVDNDGKPKPELDQAVTALQNAMRGAIAEKLKVRAISLTARLERLAKRPDRALVMYELLREQDPKRTYPAITALWVGEGLHGQRKYKAAIRWLELDKKLHDNTANDKLTAAQLAGVQAKSKYLTAQAYHRLKDYPKAITRYGQLVGLSKGYAVRAQLGLAQAMADAGRHDDALNEYEGLTAVRDSRVAATALLQSGEIYAHRALKELERKNTINAKKDYDNAALRLNRVSLLFDKKPLENLVFRSLILQGRLADRFVNQEKALEKYRGIIERKTQSLWKRIAGAEIALTEKKRGQALVEFRRILKQSTDNSVSNYVTRRLTELGEQP